MDESSWVPDTQLMLFIGVGQVSGALDTQLMLQTEDRHMSCALSEPCDGVGLVLGWLMDTHLMHHAGTLLSGGHPTCAAQWGWMSIGCHLKPLNVVGQVKGICFV